MATKSFQVLKEGTAYRLPQFRMVAGSGLEETDRVCEISFVRGSIRRDDDQESVEGILLENLLELVIADVKFKSDKVPSDEADRMLYHLNSALDVMLARIHRRQRAGVFGSYESVPDEPVK